MNNISKEDLQRMKREAKIAAKFEDYVGIVKTIERDIDEYEEALEIGEESQIEQKRNRLENNYAVIKDIISEHDYIKAILDGEGEATNDQLEILLFPRTSAKTNILHVAGGPGTGKTLILLARILQEISNQTLPGGKIGGKRALFICFNKSLSKYAMSILSRFELDIKDIDIVNVDKFVKDVVENCPDFKDKKIHYGGIPDGIIEKFSIEYQGDNLGFLDSSNKDAKDWLSDEVDWIESRTEIEFGGDIFQYYSVGRIGRGNQPFNPQRGTKENPSASRKAVLAIMNEYYDWLKANGKYTYAQAVNYLLKNRPPAMSDIDNDAYDIIAVDEVQDITVASLRLLNRFRKPSSKMFISGDEGQKIYKRDFKWRQISDDTVGNTVTLKENFRNHADIALFASVLNDDSMTDSDLVIISDAVKIAKKSYEEIVKELKGLAKQQGTTCIIVDTKNQVATWEQMLKNASVDATAIYQKGDIFGKGIYIANIHQIKGLEFDHVIIPSMRMVFNDEELCKNLYYVAFTRARNHLSIYYQDKPSEFFNIYYGDYIAHASSLTQTYDEFEELPF